MRNYTVRPPRDVVITSDFRKAAAAAAASTSLGGVRRALKHVVSGHWRKQLVGPGRAETRLTWVRPHVRGDESLGRVVSRITNVRPIN